MIQVLILLRQYRTAQRAKELCGITLTCLQGCETVACSQPP